MGTLTSNLSLTKPAASDNVSIATLNTNFDIIDNAIGTMNSTIDNVENEFESVSVTLTAAGWSATAPYEQTVVVSGMTSTWVPGVPTYNFGNSVPTATALESALVEMAKIKMIISSSNQLKFVAPSVKPTASVPLIVPGQKVRT